MTDSAPAPDRQLEPVRGVESVPGLEPVPGSESVPGLESVLRLENVTLRFEDEVALDNVSLTVAPGETRIFFGSAGSGKTVILKLALGLIRPTSGRVFLFGEDITDKDERDLFGLRAKAGMLFQESGLFDSFTIEDNVAYPLLNQKSILCPEADVLPRVTEALRFVELEDTLEKFPSELSGGMRRRVGIARASVTDPPLVMFDSPTAGLDPITANNIMAFVAKQRDLKQTTVIIVTHRYQDGILMTDFRYDAEAARLIPVGDHETRTIFTVMRNGTIAFEGSRAALEASTDEYVSRFVRHPETSA